MTREKQIEDNIEAAMGCLDHLSPAMPEPFFYTRLSARMIKEEKNIWERLSRTITRPAIAGFSVILIIVANIFVVLYHTVKASVPDQAEIAMADEYSRTAFVYNLDNVQP